MIEKQHYTFHCLGLPHTVTNKEYSGCAYTQKVRRFCDMMTKRGHTVYHYGHAESEVNCTEHITVTTNQDLEMAYGNYDWRKQFFKFDMNDYVYQKFYRNTVKEINKRKKKNDFLLCFFGWGHKPVADQCSDMIVVEPGIGYATGQFAKFRIYESYAIRSAVNGHEAVAQCKEDWYHCVIPNYFDPEDFEYSEEKEDYFLFLGRVYGGKGVQIAYQVCDHLGENLVLAGQGSLEEMGYKQTEHIQHIGYANTEVRKKLMSKAKGFFYPSQFNEPWGGAICEAGMSGCPVITTDWGAFSENVVHGKTGYRCRTFSEFVWAAENIKNLKPINCRNYILQNYSSERVALMYEHYFEMVMDTYTGKGWYEPHPERTNLDWLNKEYNFV
jgi:glycosyltransferase involved in cell wall biosynthesis